MSHERYVAATERSTLVYIGSLLSLEPE